MTKVLPNFRAQFASKALFYWIVPSNCSENSLVLFMRSLGFGVLFWPLILYSAQALGEKLKGSLLKSAFEKARAH